MYYLSLEINNISFLLIKNTLLDMTINNPIFIFSVITVIWFIPGIMVRNYNERRSKIIKKKKQSDAIEKLYPKGNDNES